MMNSRMTALLIKLLIITALAYLGVMAGMYLMQRKLVYHPTETPAYAKHYGLENVKVVRVPSTDGLQLVAWHLRTQEHYPTIIYFHGNSGTLADRADKYRTLAAEGFNIIATSYRGFSGNEGSPSERGLYDDARAAIAYAKTQALPEDRLIFYGESLGTGVAVQMATEFHPAALILEAPYTSIADRAAELYPWLPVHFLMKDHFDSLSKISKVTSPLLILHGEADETIPVAHGRALLAAATAPKKGVFFPGIGHVDFDMETQAREVAIFSKEQGIVK